jgi:carbohydrate kinase (thermoresistant glucokinase family)
VSVVYVIMGVSGCGKSTVGEALAARLGCPFYDGDDFHPPQNVAKMAGGRPLTDDDRQPWLARLHDLIAEHTTRGETAVLACSALKKKYRDQLRMDSKTVQFIYLEGTFDLIWQRLASRSGHYMKAAMLQSQFDALEPPASAEVFTVSIDQTPAQILTEILQFVTG